MLERIPPREWRDLGIAWFAITLAFTIAFLYDRYSSGLPIAITDFVFLFIMSSVTVGVGFLLHELAHKFTAIRYGYWAEFQKDNGMLLLAVLLAAVVGVVFAAPGATMIYSPAGGPGLSKRENGLISAAGPGINLLLVLPFIPAAFLGTGLVAAVGFMGWQVNSMLAAFNMLPFGNLDGKKIFHWNPGVFVLLLGVAFLLLYLSFFPAFLGPLFPSP